MEIRTTKDGLEIFNIDGKDIRWRNFSGNADRFGKTTRKFSIILPEELAHQLHEDNWIIQYLDSDKYEPSLKVNFTFNYTPFELFQLSGPNYKRMTRLDPDTAGNLDYAEIDHMDLIINGRTSDLYEGISASAETIWVYIRTSDLKERYQSRYRYVGNGQYELNDDVEYDNVEIGEL